MKKVWLMAISLALVAVASGIVGYTVFSPNSLLSAPQPPIPALPPYSGGQTLTEEEKSRAIELAINDQEVKKWLSKGYEIYEVVPLFSEEESSRMCMVYILTEEQKLPWVPGITIGVPVDLLHEEAQGINFELKLASLTENQKEAVLRIAFADPEVLKVIGGKEYEIQGVGIDYWESCYKGKCSFHVHPAVSINVNPDP